MVLTQAWLMQNAAEQGLLLAEGRVLRPVDSTNIPANETLRNLGRQRAVRSDRVPPKARTRPR